MSMTDYYDSETGLRFPAEQQGQDGLRPVFRWEPKQNGSKSAEAGRPIFDQVPYVEILIPGDNKTGIDRPVNEDDKQRWPEQWAAFMRGQDQPLQGQPLENWPALNRGQAAELIALKFRTVEDVANASDAACQQYTGLTDLRTKAQAHIAVAGDDGVIYQAIEKNDRLSEELEAVRAENKELRVQNETLATRLDALEEGARQAAIEAATPKRRGRPPKTPPSDS